MRDRISPLPHHCWTYWVFVLCFGCTHISGSPIHSYILAIGLLPVSLAPVQFMFSLYGSNLNKSGFMFFLVGLKITRSPRHVFFLCPAVLCFSSRLSKPIRVRIFYFYFIFLPEEPCMHNSLKLAVYVVVVVFFLIKLTLIGTNCARQKVNRDFHHSELKKVNTQMVRGQVEGQNCKIIPLTHQWASDVASSQWMWNRRLLTFNHNFSMRRNLRGTAFD